MCIRDSLHAAVQPFLLFSTLHQLIGVHLSDLIDVLFWLGPLEFESDPLFLWLLSFEAILTIGKVLAPDLVHCRHWLGLEKLAT